MEMDIIATGTSKVAVVNCGGDIICDASSALDLIADASFLHGTYRIAIAKECLSEDFFRLSTGLAGEILQKFVNYRAKLAIYGDFSGYTSKPLRDFIYESNKGNDIFFTSTKEESISRLSEAK